MNRQSVIEILAVLDGAALRNTPEIDGVLVDLWASNLRDTAADAALEAVRRIIREEEFFPQIANVWRLANQIQRAANQRALPVQGGGYRCRPCEDTKVILKVDGDHVSSYPCERCNPEGHQRWAAGEYRTKVFRAVLHPVDADASRVELEKVRDVLRRGDAA